MTQLIADFSAYKLTTEKREKITRRVNGWYHISGAAFVGAELHATIEYYNEAGASSLTAYIDGCRDMLERKPGKAPL